MENINKAKEEAYVAVSSLLTFERDIKSKRKVKVFKEILEHALGLIDIVETVAHVEIKKIKQSE